MAGLELLHFGCGPVIAEGWVNFDCIDWGPGVVVGDIRDGLPFEDVRFDGVVANHSLQCLTTVELPPALTELHRVLRPNGLFRVLVPDIVAAIHAWEQSDATWPGFAAIQERMYLEEKFCRYLTWGGTNRTCFTHQTLARLLMAHGFSEPLSPFLEPSWIMRLDSRPLESIALTVVKKEA